MGGLTVRRGTLLYTRIKHPFLEKFGDFYPLRHSTFLYNPIPIPKLENNVYPAQL